MKAPLPFTRPPRAIERAIVVLLGLLGVQLFMLWSGGALPLRSAVQWAISLSPLIAIAAMVAVRGASWCGWNLRSLYERWPVRVTATLLIFLASVAYLYATAEWQDRAFAPSYHDEFSYLLQARMLASGRLWVASPAVADFFESFQVVTRPVYASIYFPGAALTYAIGLIANVPGWTTSLLMSGLCVVLIYDVCGRLFGIPAGWVAAFMLLGLTIFRLQSVMVMAEIPVLSAGLGMTAVWLRWRAAPSIFSAGAIGGLFGWAAISRPVDALCFAVPIAIAMLVRTIQDARAIEAASPRPRASPIGLCSAILAMIPFFAVQSIFNYGVTGSIFRTPFTQYASESYPQTEYGFHSYDRSVAPQSTLPQKRGFYDQVARPFLERHTPAGAARSWAEGRLKTTLLNGVPHAVMFVFLPLGVLALRRPEFVVVISPVLLFPLLYWPYAFFLTHYTLVTAPAVIVMVLAGVESLASIAGRFTPVAKATAFSCIMAVTFVELPEFNRTNFDEFFKTSQLRAIEQALKTIPAEERAIVLFRWNERCNPQEEPVYNIDHAQVDDHRVIRAHDLGERNDELYAYFVTRQPERVVYRYDRGDDSLTKLGTVEQLASRYR